RDVLPGPRRALLLEAVGRPLAVEQVLGLPSDERGDERIAAAARDGPLNEGDRLGFEREHGQEPRDEGWEEGADPRAVLGAVAAGDDGDVRGELEAVEGSAVGVNELHDRGLGR